MTTGVLQASFVYLCFHNDGGIFPILFLLLYGERDHPAKLLLRNIFQHVSPLSQHVPL